jgi:eukaryotic-like serine/threonine-protein kinase
VGKTSYSGTIPFPSRAAGYGGWGPPVSEIPSNGNGKSADGGAPAQLFGFDVIDFLGEGAASLIYAVSDPQTKQVYALKHVTVKTDKQLRFAEQLINEYEVGHLINHPLVRRVIDCKVSRTLLRKITEAALVMELVDGTPLDQAGPQSIAQTLAIFGQVAQALGALHEQGFVHCDLKPNNILLCADGTIKLIDLGQACAVLTVKQRIQGTPDFIAPEQVKCEPVTAKTDIFNFGATLYWTLCEKKLPTLFNIKKSENSFVFDQLVASPAEQNPEVPLPLSNLVMECVRTNPAKRPADAVDLSRRLELMSLSLCRGTTPLGSAPPARKNAI